MCHKILLFFLALCLLPARLLAVEVQEVRSSGVTAWLVEEHTLPLLAVRVLFTEAGATSDPAGREGRAMMATDLLLEGAGGYDALAFNRALEEHAIRLAVHTDEDLLSVSMQTLGEHRDTAFALLREMLNRPRFAPDALERVRRKALTGLQQLRQEPSYLLGRALKENAFPGHPYGRPEEGTEASLARLTRDDFTQYAKRYFTRGNLIVAVAGDISPEALARLLDDTFGMLPAAFAPSYAAPHAPPLRGGQHVAPFAIPQTQVAFALPGVARDDPAYFDAHVLNYLLGGGGLTSRLGKEIREKRGLAYGATSHLELLRHGALLVGNFSTRNPQAGEALAVMRQAIEELLAHGITTSELEDAKRYLTGSFVLGLDTNREVATLLATMQFYGLGRDYIDRRAQMIEAVTTESVARMAQRLLDISHLLVVMVGQPEGIEHAP